MLLNFDSSKEKVIAILLWSPFHLGFKHVSLIFKAKLFLALLQLPITFKLSSQIYLLNGRSVHNSIWHLLYSSIEFWKLLPIFLAHQVSFLTHPTWPFEISNTIAHSPFEIVLHWFLSYCDCITLGGPCFLCRFFFLGLNVGFPWFNSWPFLFSIYPLLLGVCIHFQDFNYNLLMISYLFLDQAFNKI